MEGFHYFHDAMSRALYRASVAANDETRLAGIPTGIEVLDKWSGGLQPKQLTLLAGSYGVGKTSLRRIAYQIAAGKDLSASGTSSYRGRGGVVGFYSFTMSAEELATSIISEQAGISEDRVRRGDVTQSEFDRLLSISQSMQKVPLFIDETASGSVARLAARARRLKRQRGLDVLVVDSIQSLVSSEEAQERDGDMTFSTVTRGLKSLARELGIPVIGGFEVRSLDAEPAASLKDVSLLRRSLKEGVVDFAAIIGASSDMTDYEIEILQAQEDELENPAPAHANTAGSERELDEYISRKLREWELSLERIDEHHAQYRAHLRA